MKINHCTISRCISNKRQIRSELYIRDVAEKSQSSCSTNTAEADTETCISFPRMTKRFLILYLPGFSEEHSSSIELLAKAYTCSQRSTETGAKWGWSKEQNEE